MLDIGWSELLLIGVVALIVVGPKDLPVMFHTLGRITAKARAMAREFSRAMEDAAKETGLDETAKDLQGLASKKSLGLEALERATEKFEKWDPKFPAADSTTPAVPPKLEPDPGMAEALDAAERAFEPGEEGAPAVPADSVPAPAPTAAATTAPPEAARHDAAKHDAGPGLGKEQA